MAQARRKPLERREFLAAVERLLDGTRGYSDATRWVLDRNELEPVFEQDLLVLGAVTFVRERVGTQPRGEIMRSVGVVYKHYDPKHYTVSVVRSPLRDWHISAADASGRTMFKRFETCTVDEVERSVEHDEATVNGINRRIRIKRAAIEAARERGVEVMGDLDDDTMDACLREGDE